MVPPASPSSPSGARGSGQQRPRLDDGDIRMEFADVAAKIRRILEDNDAGKSRVVLDPENVARLHGIAERLAAVPGVLTPTAQ
jgi:hypothetical protein